MTQEPSKRDEKTRKKQLSLSISILGLMKSEHLCKNLIGQRL